MKRSPGACRRVVRQVHHERVCRHERYVTMSGVWMFYGQKSNRHHLTAIKAISSLSLNPAARLASILKGPRNVGAL